MKYVLTISDVFEMILHFFKHFHPIQKRFVRIKLLLTRVSTAVEFQTDTLQQVNTCSFIIWGKIDFHHQSPPILFDIFECELSLLSLALIKRAFDKVIMSGINSKHLQYCMKTNEGNPSQKESWAWGVQSPKASLEGP